MGALDHRDARPALKASTSQNAYWRSRLLCLMTRLVHCFKSKPLPQLHFSCLRGNQSLIRGIRFVVASLLVSAGCVCPVEAQQPPPSPPKQPLPAQPLRAVDVLMSLSSDMQTLAHAIEPAVVKIY